MAKNLPAMQEDWCSIPGSGRSPGEGNGNPFLCSCQENSVDRGARQTTVHGVPKHQTQLSNVEGGGCLMEYHHYWLIRPFSLCFVPKATVPSRPFQEAFTIQHTDSVIASVSCVHFFSDLIDCSLPASFVLGMKNV